MKTVQEKGVAAFAEGFLKAAFTPSSFTERPAIVDAIRHGILKTPAKGVIATLIALATRTDTTAFLPRIQVPTLILVGEADAITPPDAAKAMNERIVGSQLVMVQYRTSEQSRKSRRV